MVNEYKPYSLCKRSLRSNKRETFYVKKEK